MNTKAEPFHSLDSAIQLLTIEFIITIRSLNPTEKERGSIIRHQNLIPAIDILALVILFIFDLNSDITWQKRSYTASLSRKSL